MSSVDGEDDPPLGAIVCLGNRVCVRSVAGGGHWYSEKHNRFGGAEWYAMYADQNSTRHLCLEDLVMFLDRDGSDGSPAHSRPHVGERATPAATTQLAYNRYVSMRSMTASKRGGRFLDGSHSYALWGKGREALQDKAVQRDQRYLFRVCSAVYDEEDDSWAPDPAAAGDEVRYGALVLIEVDYQEEKHLVDTQYLSAHHGWLQPSSHLTDACVFELLQPNVDMLAKSDPAEYEGLPDEIFENQRFYATGHDWNAAGRKYYFKTDPAHFSSLDYEDRFGHVQTKDGLGHWLLDNRSVGTDIDGWVHGHDFASLLKQSVTVWREQGQGTSAGDGQDGATTSGKSARRTSSFLGSLFSSKAATITVRRRRWIRRDSALGRHLLGADLQGNDVEKLAAAGVLEATSGGSRQRSRSKAGRKKAQGGAKLNGDSDTTHDNGGKTDGDDSVGDINDLQVLADGLDLDGDDGDDDDEVKTHDDARGTAGDGTLVIAGDEDAGEHKPHSCPVLIRLHRGIKAPAPPAASTVAQVLPAAESDQSWDTGVLGLLVVDTAAGVLRVTLDAPGDGALAWDDHDAAADASDSLSSRAKAEKLAAEATTLSPWVIAEQRTRGNRRGAQKRPAKPARELTLPLESVWAVEAVRAVNVHKEGDVDEFGLAIPTQWQRHLAVSFAPGTLRLDDAVLPCSDATSAVLFLRADDTWTSLGAEQEDENFGVVGKPELLRTDYDVTLQQLLDSSPTHDKVLESLHNTAMRLRQGYLHMLKTEKPSWGVGDAMEEQKAVEGVIDQYVAKQKAILDDVAAEVHAIQDSNWAASFKERSTQLVADMAATHDKDLEELQRGLDIVKRQTARLEKSAQELDRISKEQITLTKAYAQPLIPDGRDVDLDAEVDSAFSKLAAPLKKLKALATGDVGGVAGAFASDAMAGLKASVGGGEEEAKAGGATSGGKAPAQATPEADAGAGAGAGAGGSGPGDGGGGKDDGAGDGAGAVAVDVADAKEEEEPVKLGVMKTSNHKVLIKVIACWCCINVILAIVVSAIPG